MINQAFITDPQYEILVNEFSAFAKKYTKEQFNVNEKGPIFQIPIVFHVLHNYGNENVSDASLLGALEDMNDAWRKRDPDTSNISHPFNLIHDDMEIEFVLAKKDPNGDCTTGITRYVSELTKDADDGVKTYTKSFIDWPSNEYLNVWIVTNCESGAGGYAYYPGASPSIDGIVLPTNVFRNLAHEAGHWLSLRHPWGSTNSPDCDGSTIAGCEIDGTNPVQYFDNCTSDDDVDDTPNCLGSPSNCNTSRLTCSGDPDPFYSLDSMVLWSGSEIIDNEQNYMDYGWCNAENFTQGQKARAHSALNNVAGGRNYIWTANNIASTGISSSFICEPVPIPDFHLTYEYSCVDKNVQMLNNSYNSNNMNYLWGFGSIANASSTTTVKPTVSWNETGHHDISLTVSNTSGDGSTLTKTGLAKVLNSEPIPPFKESFKASSFPTNDITDPTKTWFVDGVTNANSWKRTIAASTEGSSSLFLDIKNTSGIHRVITPMVDFTQLSCNDLTFDLAYAPRTTSTNETFRARVSTTCGRTWIDNNIIYEVSGQNIAPNSPVLSGDFIPTESDWMSHTVDLSNYNDEDEILVMFEFLSATGNSIYFDNINFGCSSQDLTSVNENQEFSFGVFPNPTSSDARIRLSSNQDNAIIRITDVTGKLIGEKELTQNTTEIRVSDIVNSTLENGVYLVSVENNNSLKTQKLIIK